ncbi:MAG: nitroreductase family deazaflavin-dependent oxidoreductase [Dehalococcoidia bacterium]|nr:nitroreductase family deazaflavin-dependent oxidoreductase [Dehalococcoidia bacterium]
MVREGDSVIGYLTTLGRVSGRPHIVTLRLVYHGGKFYASRRDTASDWCRNLMAEPRVTIRLDGEEIRATARVIDDVELAGKVSGLKYRDQRALKPRVIVEMVPGAG